MGFDTGDLAIPKFAIGSSRFDSDVDMQYASDESWATADFVLPCGKNRSIGARRPS
jgi:hypothetical protein